MAGCTVCGGALGERGRALTIIAAPGIGEDGTVHLTPQIHEVAVCERCHDGEPGIILRTLLKSPWTRQSTPRGYCEVKCHHPARRIPVIGLKRTGFRRKQRCPHCFGPAWVTPAPGARVWKPSIVDFLLRRVRVRPDHPAELAQAMWFDPARLDDRQAVPVTPYALPDLDNEGDTAP